MMAEDLNALVALATKLPTPTNYFEGAGRAGAALPAGVLLFSRLSRAALQPRDAFRHRRFVLVLNLAGTGSVALDGRWHTLQPGGALLVFPHQVHAFANLRSDSPCWLFLTFELPAEAWPEELRNRLLATSTQGRRWLGELLRCRLAAANEPEPVVLLTALLLHELRTSLRADDRTARKERVRRVRDGNASAPARSPALVDSPLEHLLPLIHQIVENENPGAHIGTLSRRLGVSESHLRAEFRKQTGMSLGHYLRDIRVNRAAAMLVETKRWIGEIADRCGFASADAFSRTFRQTMRMSPRTYRQRALRP